MKTNTVSAAQTAPDVIAALLSKDIELRDTTSTQEASSIRVIDALPRKIQTVDFLTGGYCVAKLYGPNRDQFVKLFVAAPELLAALNKTMATLRDLRADHEGAWHDSEVAEVDAAVTEAKAAIARAEGRT